MNNQDSHCPCGTDGEQVKLHDRSDIRGRRRRGSAHKLDAGPGRDVPDRELADQLRLVEAVTLTLGREVGEPVQRQPGIRALARLPLDRFHRSSGTRGMRLLVWTNPS